MHTAHTETNQAQNNSFSSEDGTSSLTYSTRRLNRRQQIRLDIRTRNTVCFYLAATGAGVPGARSELHIRPSFLAALSARVSVYTVTWPERNVSAAPAWQLRKHPRRDRQRSTRLWIAGYIATHSCGRGETAGPAQMESPTRRTEAGGLVWSGVLPSSGG